MVDSESLVLVSDHWSDSPRIQFFWLSIYEDDRLPSLISKYIKLTKNTATTVLCFSVPVLVSDFVPCNLK
jgi:hypothetical protein